MTDGEKRGARGDEGDRRIVYCLVPPELAPKLHDLLRDHFAADPGVEVVVERRAGERRRTAERRQRDARPPPDGERRRIRSATGRRMAERRVASVPAEAPALPRRARRHAAQLRFVERLEPATQPAEDLDTARLVTRFQGGEREAFTTLYTRYFDRVYGYLRALLRDSHEAEDAAQHVFTQVFEALPGYEFRGRPFRAWLFTIVRNHAINRLRELDRVDVIDPAELARRTDRLAEARLDLGATDWISDKDLLLFIERLPGPQRQVLMMRYLLELSATEIAAVMERSPDDVRMLQHRAQRFLRSRLTALGHCSARGRGGAAMRTRVPEATILRARRFAIYR